MKIFNFGLLVAGMLLTSGCIDKSYKPSLVSNLEDDILVSVSASDGTVHEGIIRPCVKTNLGEPDSSTRVIQIKVPNSEPLIIRGAEILEMAAEQKSAGPNAIWVISASGLELHDNRDNVIGCTTDSIR